MTTALVRDLSSSRDRCVALAGTDTGVFRFIIEFSFSQESTFLRFRGDGELKSIFLELGCL